MNKKSVSKIVRHLPRDPTRLLDYLWAIQRAKGFISPLDIFELAKLLKIDESRIKEVITFYHFFFDKPHGEFSIFLDQSIIAKHAGIDLIEKVFEEALGVKSGQMTDDWQFGLYKTSCIGMSDQAPAALINMIPFVNLTTDKVLTLITCLKRGDELLKLQKDLDCVPQNTVHQSLVTQDQWDQDITSLHTQILNPQDIIQEIISSGLRGRGGAGFPTGKKWQLCRQYPGPRVVVCNADEGEPGTFKDRYLLTEHATKLFYGMAIAAKAIESQEAYLYLRAEYTYLLDHLHFVLTKLQRDPLIRQIKWRIQLGAGAYVVGEESALLESLEGKRGEPRLRPPFPVEKGYLGKPTIVNNVETFVLVSKVLEKGFESFRKWGTDQSAGVRWLSISGDVSKPGLYEVPWGIRLREVLELCGAQSPLMIQVGGPSGECINATILSELERKLSFEDLPTGGSFMVFSKERDIFTILQNFMQFFVDESCGNCTPCRAGNVVLNNQLKKVVDGHGRPQDLMSLTQWSHVVMKTSRCGLGMSSPRVITTSMKAFPEIYQHKIDSSKSSLIFDFDEQKATSDYDKIFGENHE
ncbi:MAG: NADP oxidoreductase [Bdellovibrio sp. CG11_big_fil_rev_8_21_14_0_20_39_38]|nr:MAG: NADP oxidoreductase [Bdellovibrio sp. CG22_combo_CG10-13_8_21_14_all_39_27]PIR32671.1 MAG: NADP oxidoreductase [Bdellovibrio sp. CG11_big_fil_rev_8_21_14_0_20_39_38]